MPVVARYPNPRAARAAKRRGVKAATASKRKKVPAKEPAKTRTRVTAASKRKARAAKSAATATTRTSPNPRGRASRSSVNTATNRDFDAAPGRTNPNPRARALSLKRDVTGGVQTKAGTYKTYKKKSAAAKSFRSAFASAKKQGYKTFTWNGKKYNTKTK